MDRLAGGCLSVVSEEVTRYNWQTRQHGLLDRSQYSAMTAEQQTAIGEVSGGGGVDGDECTHYLAMGGQVGARVGVGVVSPPRGGK